ncbi:hypothetical protein [Corynebacterium epidermidicanis]|uniref:Uncharacterized protein n=1 Tax=Corynebacterium epidermidicanis TaxID=1050174 RepID=A0A0G3GQT1_9CORY|nr:hypothetical protein [Corynebacterium epidermidicanis]AKK03566.1 hypothetical protein CEPID_08580 [Corynebacterium epidermidicanis]
MIKLPWRIVATLAALVIAFSYTMDLPYYVIIALAVLVMTIVWLPWFHERKQPQIQ